MNRQHLLSRLAKRHQVLYSNGPWSVWDRHQLEFRASRWAGSFQQQDGVWVDQPPKLLLSWPTRLAWELITTPIAVTRWRRQLARMGSGPTVAYVFHPMYLQYVERMRADLIVYSPFDLFSKMPDWSDEKSAEEQRLVDLCGLVITSSEPTRHALQQKTAKPVFCVPNGVDADLFEAGSALPPPPDLAAIPRPRIGYVGSLNRKVDFPLIRNIALREPSWHFVFIGLEGNFDDVTGAAIEQCRQLPNVHFLPSKPVANLPMYMGALDVGLMCYRKDTWADFGYPLKLHEYLASGLPVVSTPLQSIRGCDEWIETADDEQSWRNAIGRALNGHGRSTPGARRAEAHRNTWDARVATIDELLTAALNGTLEHRPSKATAGGAH
jgi:glycosyltransferase involved in cell wall biosynthesis